MSSEALIQQLLLEDEENSILDEIESEVAKDIESCSKNDAFYNLNFKRLLSIFSRTPPLQLKIASSILAKLSEKYSGDVCLLLKTINVEVNTCEDCCFLLSSIKGSHFCETVRTILASQSDVDVDWEFEIHQRDEEIKKLKESSMPKLPPIPPELLKPLEAKPIRYDPNIHRACENGSLDSVKYLIQNGTLIDKVDRDQVTPLMKACEFKKLPIVQYLIANGANIEAQDNAGWTPLLWAIRGGSKPVIDFLLQSGANIETGDQNNATPLMFAAEEGDDSLVNFLLQKGANPFAKDKFRNSAADLTDDDYTRRIILNAQKNLIQMHNQQN